MDSSQPVVPKCLEIPRFGCLPKPLQNQTVRWSLWALVCVLWGGVHKGYENVGLTRMPSHTVATTDGLVDGLGTFLCFVRRGRENATTGSNVRKGRFKRIQLHRLEKVGLKAFLECLEFPRFGCLPKLLQKRMVRWSFWQLVCVLWGGVHKG